MGTGRKRLQAARAMQPDQSVAHAKVHALVAARLAGDEGQSMEIIAGMSLDEARRAAWQLAETVAVLEAGEDRSPDQALRYYAAVGLIQAGGAL